MRVARRRIAGAVVRDGQRAWSQAIETTTDTQFRIGSLTKTFIAVLVMRLRDEGRLGLDDPLEKYLADAPVRGVTNRAAPRRQATMQAGIEPITVGFSLGTPRSGPQRIGGDA